jgi:NAD(P) transhydrogenase
MLRRGGPRLPVEIVEELIHQMRHRNVTFRFGEAVEAIEVPDELPRRAVMRLDSGKGLVADVVLFSAGRLAATGPLSAPAQPKLPDQYSSHGITLA